MLACLIHQHHTKTISVIKSSLNYNNSENTLYFKTLFPELDFSDISYRDFVSPRWDWELSLLMQTLFLCHFALCIPQRIFTSLHAHLEIIQFNHTTINNKESACQCRSRRKCRFNPWVGKIPWRRQWQSAPVLLSGESSHGERSLAGYSP